MKDILVVSKNMTRSGQKRPFSIRKFWEYPLFEQMFVVVDEDINVHDMDDVIWAITTRADAARDTIIINNTPTDTLDPASPLVNLGSKMGIDATQKTKEEGYMREIQQQVKVDEKTKNLVDSKWSEYGL